MMTLTEKSDICDVCAYDPCFCGGEPEICMWLLDADNVRDLLAAEFKETSSGCEGEGYRSEHDV